MVDVMQWQNLPNQTTPLSATRLNQWSSDVKLVADAAQASADAAAASAAAAVAPTDTQVAGFIKDPASLTSVALGVVIVAGTGIDPTGAADSTVAMRAKFATAGAARFIVPPGTYKVAIPIGETLATFTNRQGITIDAPGVTINNTTAYTSATLTPIFLVDGGRNFRLTLGEYVGVVLADPGTNLGYWGATLVRAINAVDGVSVDAKITNARYGVQTGAYETPSEGECRGFDLRIRGSLVGYPFAGYLARDIRLDIDVTSVHRAAYIAGCDNVTGVVRWANIYIAPYAVLITDALTSGTDAAAQIDPVGAATTSRGSSNVDIVSMDLGSTVHPADMYCAAISLSRVDPCTFRNIKIRVSTSATNTVSTTVHGVAITSTAPSIWSRYTYQWESTVVLENIKVSGVVDHSGSTASSGAYGALNIVAQENAAHAATVRGLDIENYHILAGSAGYVASSVRALGMVSPVQLRGVYSPSAGLLLETSQSIPTTMEDCRLSALDTSLVTNGPKLIMGPGTVIGSRVGSAYRTESLGGIVGGAGGMLRQQETTLTLTGATVTWTYPVGPCLLLGVQGRFQTAITGATGLTVGIPTDLDRFADLTATAAGTTFGIAAQAADELYPRWYPGGTSITVTAKTANFTGGTLRLVLTYLELSTPTA